MDWTDSGDLLSNSKSPASAPNWLALLVRSLFPKNDIGVCSKLWSVHPKLVNGAIQFVAKSGQGETRLAFERLQEIAGEVETLNFNFRECLSNLLKS